MRRRALHHFLLQTSLYPLLLASALACGMIGARLLVYPSPAYVHMIWNLFLAWIPYLCSLCLWALHQRDRSAWLLIGPGALWLLFLPNAPYMVTEFVHLLRLPVFTLWYDIGMIAAGAWTGSLLAVVSLQLVHEIVAARLGRVSGWLTVVAAAGLSGLGVYLGRFLRWNSWDVVRDPHGLFTDLATRMLNPLSFPRIYGVTIMWATLLLICYLTIASIRTSNKPGRGAPRPARQP